ncbi:MAG: type II toxin-antitoxin system RelE/ParE family toxin [Bacilli bacterium]|nr:type II toxin-antitoxin system RelE/ParE family toxin [Bacilli bacterium]
MYRIEFLPIAKKDIDDIIYYISHNLKNITASKKLIDLFMSSIDSILEFPYKSSIYQPIDVLKNEYRTYKVKNFLMFYTINEEKKLITIVRVLYQKMDISNILE